MKEKYIIILAILTSFFILNIYYLNIDKIKNQKNITFGKYNLRSLLDNDINYDTSIRTDKNDRESIENCQNTEYKYFIQYISGYNVTFDKDIDTDRSVKNKYII